MIEIFYLIAALVSLLSAAKKRPRRRFTSNMKMVRFQGVLPVTNLQSLDAVTGILIPASDSAYRVLSLNFNAVWESITALADGGAMFGVSHGDYTAAEIEECLEAGVSINRGNKIANEQANRLVRILGTFPSTNSTVVDGEVGFNDGRPRKVKLNWPIPIGNTLNIWMYNTSDAGYTTGTNLAMNGTAVVAYS